MMEYLFLILLPTTAFLYASVGHGGASGYLALMALFSFATNDSRIIALLLNLCVAGIGFYHFQKGGFFKFKLLLPFIIGSIPAAFIGGMIDIDPMWYKRILGVFLLLATARFLTSPTSGKDQSASSFPLAIGIGACIGLLSGMIGIGGGIILSPVILLLGWANLKETAAISASFIVINSALGLAGHFVKNWTLDLSISTGYTLLIIGLAILGGFAGSLWGSQLKKVNQLKYVLVGVLLLASIKLWIA